MSDAHRSEYFMDQNESQMHQIGQQLTELVGQHMLDSTSWLDAQGTTKVIINTGDGFTYSEKGAEDPVDSGSAVVELTFSNDTETIDGHGTTLDSFREAMQLTEQDARVLYLLGSLASHPSVKEQEATSRAIDLMTQETEVSDTPAEAIWRMAGEIESITSYDGCYGRYQDQDGVLTWRSSYVGNNGEFVRSTFGYYGGQQEGFVPEITVEKLDPNTFEPTSTVRYQVVDDQRASRIDEPAELRSVTEQPSSTAMMIMHAEVMQLLEQTRIQNPQYSGEHS